MQEPVMPTVNIAAMIVILFVDIILRVHLEVFNFSQTGLKSYNEISSYIEIAYRVILELSERINGS